MYAIKNHYIEGSPIPCNLYYYALSKGYDEEKILENFDAIETSFMDMVEKKRSELSHLVNVYNTNKGKKLIAAKEAFCQTEKYEVLKKTNRKVGNMTFFLLIESMIHLEIRLTNRKFPEAYLIAAWEAAKGQYGQYVDYFGIHACYGSPIDILVQSIVTPVWPGIISTTAEIQLEVETLLYLPDPLVEFKLLKLGQEIDFIQCLKKTFNKSPYLSAEDQLSKRAKAIMNVIDVQDRELRKTLLSVL